MKAFTCIFVSAAVSGMAIGCAGCGSPAPDRSDLVGRWSRGDAGIVEFRKDGRFVARNIVSEDLLAPDEGLSERISVTGRWRLLVQPGKREFGSYQWPIEVSVDPIAGHAPRGAVLQSTFVPGSPNGIILSGDPDSFTLYKRATISE